MIKSGSFASRVPSLAVFLAAAAGLIVLVSILMFFVELSSKKALEKGRPTVHSYQSAAQATDALGFYVPEAREPAGWKLISVTSARVLPGDEEDSIYLRYDSTATNDRLILIVLHDPFAQYDLPGPPFYQETTITGQHAVWNDSDVWWRLGDVLIDARLIRETGASPVSSIDDILALLETVG